MRYSIKTLLETDECDKTLRTLFVVVLRVFYFFFAIVCRDQNFFFFFLVFISIFLSFEVKKTKTKTGKEISTKRSPEMLVVISVSAVWPKPLVVRARTDTRYVVPGWRPENMW